MPTKTTTKKATKKVAPKSATKPAVKGPVSKTTKPTTTAKATTTTPKPKAEKKTRNSNPIYADVTLGKIKELFGDDDTAVIKVGRNFILDAQRAKLDDAAQLELGI